MMEEKKHFVYGDESLNIKGCIANGISEEIANTIYDQMMSFASYAFNKSHAAAYAAISMQTAYLKAHYPTEFYAGLLTSEMDDTEKLAEYVADCKHNGVRVLPPDINSSDKTFKVMNENELCYGLVSIKQAGPELIDYILNERAQNGLFKSLYDFMSRCDETNKGVIENFIKAGAFDFTGFNRPSLIAAIQRLQNGIKKENNKLDNGQISLFTNDTDGQYEPPVTRLPDQPVIAKALAEKEVTGMFITQHPLECDSIITYPHLHYAKSIAAVKASNLDKLSKITFSIKGIITNVKTIYTKATHQKMAYITLEDATDAIDVIVFPKTYAAFCINPPKPLDKDTIISVTGQINIKEDDTELAFNAKNILYH